MQEKSRITMLHLCKGRRLMLDLLHDYPVHAISWSHRTSQPSLAEARQLTKKALATGVSLQALHEGKEADVLAEAREAVAQAGRKTFILASACVIRATAPDANLAAIRRAVEE